MGNITQYEAQKKKLEGLCEEHELSYRFVKDSYPMLLKVTPLQGMESQISMLEAPEDDGYRSPDAAMIWIFEDGALTTRSYGTFTISKTLRTKIENIWLKMIACWLEYFFNAVMNNKDALRPGFFPVIDEREAGNDDLPDGAEPLEEDADEEDIEDAPEELAPDDPLVIEAKAIVRAENKATTSLLQRRMGIGYAKAARVMDALEALGVVGPFAGGQPREVLPADEPED